MVVAVVVVWTVVVLFGEDDPETVVVEETVVLDTGGLYPWLELKLVRLVALYCGTVVVATEWGRWGSRSMSAITAIASAATTAANTFLSLSSISQHPCYRMPGGLIILFAGVALTHQQGIQT